MWLAACSKSGPTSLPLRALALFTQGSIIETTTKLTQPKFPALRPGHDFVNLAGKVESCSQQHPNKEACYLIKCPFRASRVCRHCKL